MSTLASLVSGIAENPNLLSAIINSPDTFAAIYGMSVQELGEVTQMLSQSSWLTRTGVMELRAGLEQITPTAWPEPPLP